MRGDIIRRSLQDQNKVGIGRGANTDTSQWDAGVELEREEGDTQTERDLSGGWWGSCLETAKHEGDPADTAKS